MTAEYSVIVLCRVSNFS